MGNNTHICLNRRNFSLGLCSIAAMESGLAQTTAQPDILYGGARWREAADAPWRHGLARVTPPDSEQRGAVRVADSPFFPHGWVLDALNPGRAFFFEKEGPGAGVFDLRTMQLLQTIAPVQGRWFYGHGALADNNRVLLSTESDVQGRGAIGMRDAKTLQYLGDFPSYGNRPHDCHLIERGRVLVVSNGGGTREAGPTPCVSYIDVKTQRLLHKHDMPGQDYNTGHLAPVDRDHAVVVSAPRLGLGPEFAGAVSLCSASGKNLHVMSEHTGLEPALLGEALSVLVLPRHDLAVVTHPTPGWLTFWDLRSKKLVFSLRLERVRGVALSANGRGLWLAHGAGAALGYLDLASRQIDTTRSVAQSMVAGSHLLNWPTA